jgi:nitroimidazol reductase NimA-like FMN-containing flavoprotein (pyridoxamine 5'-phosphate oxidase superfamily)
MVDKESVIIDRKKLDQIIHNAEYCHLACTKNDQPYLVPLAFGYDGEHVFIHTASAGKKIDLFIANPKVCLGFEIDVELVRDSSAACDWSFNYQSVSATGTISEVTGVESKINALNCIMSHYSTENWDYPLKTLSKTRVWQITIESISGKASL